MPGQTKMKNPKRFACTICFKKFTSLQAKKIHVILIHQNSGRYRCVFCHKSYECAFNLKVHERFHTGEKPFHCETCKVSFYVKSDLNRHFNSSLSHRRLLGKARGYDQKEQVMKIKQPNRSNGSTGAANSLAARGKPPNYQEDQEDVQSEEKSRPTGNGANKSAAPWRSPASDPSSTIFGPDESSSVFGTNLKVVFGVEYQAPD